MAETIAAFSLATNIIQFIDFGTRLTSRFRGFYKSSRKQYEAVPDLKGLTADLQRVLDDLRDSDGTLGNKGSGLPALLEECHDVASGLQEHLKSLEKAQAGRDGKLEALRLAFRSIWKEDQIQSLQDRLDRFRSQLTIHLLASLREQATGSLQQQAISLMRINESHRYTKELGTKLDEIIANTQNNGLGTLYLDFLTSKVDSTAREEERLHWHKDLLNAVLRDRRESSVTGSYNLQISEDRETEFRRRFMSRLRYDRMEDRHERVASAHEKTFKWVFQDQNKSQAKWSSFKQWLESDSEKLYWITGKAGSGKSTLMKYVLEPLPNDPSGKKTRCTEHLQSWVGGSKLLSTSFFFWNSGVALQMSRSGLLRSLLYQIFTEVPELIQLASPTLWEAMCLFNNEIPELSESELHTMLRSTVQHLPENTKLCLFIDGLDEFDGDHAALIHLLHDLLAHDNVKMCVSSRPWNVFEDAFDQSPSLRLQDLTVDDIKSFIVSSFEADANFQRLRKQEQKYTEEIVDMICLKACGVFLWVRLVVSSLLAGISYGDRLNDLVKRIDLLPPELENLYDKILDSLEPFYFAHAAQMFRLIRACPEPPSLLLFSFADEDACYDFALKQSIKPLSGEKLDYRLDSMRRRLNSRCKGLLEVSGLAPSQGSQIYGPTVQYLHRTVKDYIESNEAQTRLNAALPKSFDPHLRLSCGHLSVVKCLATESVLYLPLHSTKPLWDHVTCLMYSASRVVTSNTEKVIALIDELDRSGAKYSKISARHFEPYHTHDYELELDNHAFWLAFHPCEPSLQRPFGCHILSLAVRYGVVGYVRARVTKNCLLPKNTGHYNTKAYTVPEYPLLLDAVSRHSDWAARFDSVPCPEMVECLLDNGATFSYKAHSKLNVDPIWRYVFDGIKRASNDEKRLEDWERILTFAFRNGEKEPSKEDIRKRVGGHKRSAERIRKTQDFLDTAIANSRKGRDSSKPRFGKLKF